MINFILENFDTIFKNKTSLETLDKVILDLAIKGKLVEQNQDDEPASELIKRIKAEKQRLIDEKVIKKEKPLPPIEDEEIPFDIPNNWEWVRLGEIGLLQTGNTPSTSKAEYFGRDIPFITPADISKGKIFYENRGLSFLGKEKGRVAKQNAILQVCIGGSIGKVYYTDREVCFNQQINGIDLYICNFKYIYLILSSTYFYEELIKNSNGTATPIINKSSWGNLPIPLPPIEEQKRIVSKVEKLQSIIKDLKEIYIKNQNNRENLKKSLLSEIESQSSDKDLLKNLEIIFANFDKIIKTKEDIKDIRNLILSLAIKGKLVEQNQDDEKASELIKRIKAEKQRLIDEKVIKKEKPLPPIEDEEIPFDIPNNWEWVRLGEISYLNPRNTAEDNLITSFVPMKLIFDGYENNHLTEDKLWKDIKSGFTHFKDDDIGIAKITPCFENRKSVIFKNLKNGLGAGTTELYIIRVFSKDILNSYLLNIFKSERFIIEGIKTYTGTAGQQRVKKEFVENFLIPLPPIEEQKRIVSKVESLMKICDLLEEKITLNEKISDKLLESLTK